jgi:EmrB/QacA subfamily drug resistance transporter
MATAAPDPRRWKALALLCSAFFMVVLDIAIVNVALPKIGADLHMGQESTQWIIIAYSLTFGGFLLLGGRAADLLGRRRVFMFGTALFGLASLTCALATSQTMIVSARAFQGLGAAVITPSALSIVSTTFREGAERNKALGIWGAVGGSGAAVGVLLGGVLTKFFGWSAIFYVNVPVAIVVLLITRSIVEESKAESDHRSYDLLGAITVTGGLVALVYAISRAPNVGWGSAQTIGLFVLAAALLVAFCFIESRVKHPLAPLSFFKIRTVAGANIVGFLLGGAMFGSFFMLTYYMQGVLRYSALQAGIAFLATAGVAVFAAGAAQALVTKIGPRFIMAIGLAFVGLGQLWYIRLPVAGHYPLDLMPAFIATGIGIAFGFVPVSIVGLAGIAPKDAGLASGLVNTTQQIGGAVGTALVTTAATTKVPGIFSGTATPEELVTGAHAAFAVGVIVAALGAIASIAFIRNDDLVETEGVEAEAVPAAV